MKTTAFGHTIAVLALCGCHRQPAAPTGATAPARGIAVSQARLVLPAVKGNPGAGYFTLDNGSAAPATLVRVDIGGAKAAEMHETNGGMMKALAVVRIAPGQRAVFAPSARHVMAFGLAPALAAGGTSRIVLHFQGGKTVAAPLRIEAAGGDDMAGMDMGGKP